jgi:mercuric ion transport protein
LSIIEIRSCICSGYRSYLVEVGRKEESQVASDERLRSDGASSLTAALAAGGVLAALGAASCCVLPFALFALGVSGAWIGNLTALEPYQPIFAGLGATLIGYGFYLVYRKPQRSSACADGAYCVQPRSARIAKAGLWLAVVLFAVAVGFPRFASLFL